MVITILVYSFAPPIAPVLPEHGRNRTEKRPPVIRAAAN